MKYDISDPSHLVSTMKAHPEAFLSLGRSREVVRHRTHGGSLKDSVPSYQLIRPGEDYFCMSVKESAFINLEESHELELVKEGRWRLRQ